MRIAWGYDCGGEATRMAESFTDFYCLNSFSSQISVDVKPARLLSLASSCQPFVTKQETLATRRCEFLGHKLHLVWNYPARLVRLHFASATLCRVMEAYSHIASGRHSQAPLYLAAHSSLQRIDACRPLLPHPSICSDSTTKRRLISKV